MEGDWPVVNDFIERGWVEWEHDGRRMALDVNPEPGETVEGDEEFPLAMTREGFEALEQRKFEDDWRPEDDGENAV